MFRACCPSGASNLADSFFFSFFPNLRKIWVAFEDYIHVDDSRAVVFFFSFFFFFFLEEWKYKIVEKCWSFWEAILRKFEIVELTTAIIGWMFFNVSLIWFNFWILEIVSNLGILQSSSIGKLSTYRHPRLAFPISQRPLVGSVCIWITRWPTRAFSTNVCREINGRSGRGPPSRQGKQARKVEIKAGLTGSIHGSKNRFFSFKTWNFARRNLD